MKHSAHLRNELLRQHERIEKHLRELTDAADSSDARALQRAWTVFEADLSAHLETEEEELFPVVECFHPHEVKALRLEHRRIRNLVTELGISCDLHTLNRATVIRLVQMLGQHAAYEDRTLYRWVDELAPLGTRRRLLGLLGKTVRADLAHRDN